MSGRDRTSGNVRIRALARSTEFEGPRVIEGIQKLQLRYMRSRHGGGWLVPNEDADELMAWLEGVAGKKIDVVL